ncbi:MAG: putative DNA binding domain-containing protein [Candidatus Omnitrophica bacterium]|nr:putative DNA binding domain-containing protein [Candidatus Omnitrophota bacterium]
MIQTSREEFERWLGCVEDINLEFKVATSNFDDNRGSLFDYCAAIANGHGGKLILGVQEKPKEVKGTSYAQGTHTKIAQNVWERLRIHIEVEELFYDGKRVLVFHIPQRSPATRVKSGGKGDKFLYPVRRGESLGEMDDQRTREILNEAQPDFTAGIVPGLKLSDLDSNAIVALKQKWAKKSGRQEYLGFDDEKALRNLELIEDTGITYAALILVGKSEVIRDRLADAEITFEWRHDTIARNFDFRADWREPFVFADDKIWQAISARNIRFPFQDGFLQREVWAFDEKSIREAVHNAVMHRDYGIKGRSVLIKASPSSFYIENPGGLLAPVTVENILKERAWRNRRLAEAFSKIGFAERSSQGMDDIFERSIRDGKGLPDLSGTDVNAVHLSIPAQVKDRDFILYLERFLNDRQIPLSFEEIYQLEKIRENQKVERPEFRDKFIKLGLIEMVGKGRGARYFLSRRYYETMGQSGKHTRIKGLGRDQMKELILNHIREGKPASRSDLASGFSEFSGQDISNILQELKEAGKIVFDGAPKNGTWRLKG